MSKEKQDTKDAQQEFTRIAGFTLAQELPEEELEKVVGGVGYRANNLSYTPTGCPESDCD